MNHALQATICFIILYLIGVSKCHRSSSSHRSDVYIAGFFPYGLGVENADTGTLCNHYNTFITDIKIFIE